MDLRLYDLLYEKEVKGDDLTDKEKVMELLKVGPCSVKELQAVTHYKSRGRFLAEVLQPLIDQGKVYREGNPKSPASRIRLK